MDLNDVNWRDIGADWDCPSEGMILKGVLTLNAGDVAHDFHIYAISSEEGILNCMAGTLLEELANLAAPDGPFETVELRDWPSKYVIYMYPFVE